MGFHARADRAESDDHGFDHLVSYYHDVVGDFRLCGSAWHGDGGRKYFLELVGNEIRNSGESSGLHERTYLHDGYTGDLGTVFRFLSNFNCWGDGDGGDRLFAGFDLHRNRWGYVYISKAIWQGSAERLRFGGLDGKEDWEREKTLPFWGSVFGKFAISPSRLALELERYVDLTGDRGAVFLGRIEAPLFYCIQHVRFEGSVSRFADGSRNDETLFVDVDGGHYHAFDFSGIVGCDTLHN